MSKENDMYHLDPYYLDPAGRLTLTSRELSRRAAERHAHLEAIDAADKPVARRRRRRPQEWLRIMVLPAYP
jgi:hypothetical protein